MPEKHMADEKWWRTMCGCIRWPWTAVSDTFKHSSCMECRAVHTTLMTIFGAITDPWR